MPIITSYFSTVINDPHNFGGGSSGNWVNPTNLENAPDGAYTTYDFTTQAVSSNALDFYGWQGYVTSTAIITQITVSIFGHSSILGPNNGGTTLYAYNGSLSYLFFSAFEPFPPCNSLTDIWSLNWDITSLFTLNGIFPTPTDFSNGIVGFGLTCSRDSLLVPILSLDSARMSVTWNDPTDLPYYSRKRRRYKMKRNHEEIIVSQQTKLKGAA